jgi:KTSC domain
LGFGASGTAHTAWSAHGSHFVRWTIGCAKSITDSIMLRIWFAVIAATAGTLVPTLGADSTQADDSHRIVSHIPRQPVHSTAIAKIGYSKRRHILEIEFVNGAIYRYLDVPPPAYRNLMAAESKARFYDSNIRSHYRSVLVRPRQKEQTEN